MERSRRTVMTMGNLAIDYLERLSSDQVWRRKDGAGTPMSLSLVLVQTAGSLRELLTEWEPEKPR